MADQNRQQDDAQAQGGNKTSVSASEESTGDPGRTPGQAEGDEQTADQDIEQKLGAQS